MLISVVICTWNRSTSLGRTLTSLTALTIPAGLDWEVLVIDNNSTDDTAQVVERFRPLLPIRRVLEPQQGNSFARNRALAEVAGDLLLFTDDDCVVDSDWLVAYVAAARRQPEAAVFGGPIEPDYAVPPPAWICANLDHFRGPFALIPDDPTVRPLGLLEPVFNANLAFRMSRLNGLTYDTRFGRVGTGSIGGEETEFVHRLRSLGRDCVWVGTARVRHHVPRPRMSPRYLWHWHRCKGRTIVRMDGGDRCRRLFGLPRWALRRFVREATVCCLLYPLKSRRWVEAFCQAAYFQGVLEEAWAMGRT